MFIPEVPEVVLLIAVTILQDRHEEVHGAEHPAYPWDQNLPEDLVEVVFPELLQQDIEELSLVDLLTLLLLENIDEVHETLLVG